MKGVYRWLVVTTLVLSVLAVAACARKSATPLAEKKEEAPAVVKLIEGTDLNRITLTERAAQRLGVQTVPVGEERIVRTRKVGGEIVAFPDAEPEVIPHRIEFTVTDLTKVIAGVRTRVVLISDYSGGELVEKEIAFYAQDDSGNVWYLGEYPEEYEDGQFVDAPTWIAGVEGARPGIKMKANPRPNTSPYFQGWGPAVEWSDYAQVEQVIRKRTCVTAGCYRNVLQIAESSLEETGAFQLKFYARGTGLVQVGWRGDDASQEELELIEVIQLDAPDMARVHAEALALERHAYRVSPNVYGQTSPMERQKGGGPETVAATASADVVMMPPSEVKDGLASTIEFFTFDSSQFSQPTIIDNEWLPLQPGMHWIYEGVTVERGPDPNAVWVRVLLAQSEQEAFNLAQPARVLLLDDETQGWVAERDEGPGLDDAEDPDLRNGVEIAYYRLMDEPATSLLPGQRVMVEIPMKGNGESRKVIPFSALVYDLNGDTWVYVSPEPLTFFRQPVVVEYVEGDVAVLAEGPPVGTEVAVVAVAELYGLDTGVGK